MAKKIKKKKPRSITKKRSLKSKKKVLKKVSKKKIVAKKKIKKAVSKKRRAAPASKKSATAGLEVIGMITHYFPHVNAGVIKLDKPLSLGAEIYIKGHTTDFKEKIQSMQIERVPVQSAKPGDEIGILVKKRVRCGDTVYCL